jgi:hypothetical protein
MRFLGRELGPVVEAMSGFAVAFFMMGLGTLGVLVRHSNLSVFASAGVLVWSGWVARTSVQLLRVGR